jgi:hypothetical protein
MDRADSHAAEAGVHESEAETVKDVIEAVVMIVIIGTRVATANEIVIGKKIAKLTVTRIAMLEIENAIPTGIRAAATTEKNVWTQNTSKSWLWAGYAYDIYYI